MLPRCKLHRLNESFSDVVRARVLIFYEEKVEVVLESSFIYFNPRVNCLIPSLVVIVLTTSYQLSHFLLTAGRGMVGDDQSRTAKQFIICFTFISVEESFWRSQLAARMCQDWHVRNRRIVSQMKISFGHFFFIISLQGVLISFSLLCHLKTARKDYTELFWLQAVCLPLHSFVAAPFR